MIFAFKDIHKFAISSLRFGALSCGARESVWRSYLPDWAPWRLHPGHLCKIGLSKGLCQGKYEVISEIINWAVGVMMSLLYSTFCIWVLVNPTAYTISSLRMLRGNHVFVFSNQVASSNPLGTPPDPRCRAVRLQGSVRGECSSRWFAQLGMIRLKIIVDKLDEFVQLQEQDYANSD